MSDAPAPRARPGRRRPVRRPVWTDGWCVALFLGAIALDGGLALALWRGFDSFPELVPMHFSVYGDVDIIGPKSDLYRLPLIGVVVWAVNGILALSLPERDRPLARTALGFSLGVVTLFCLAAWRIVT